MKPELIGKNGEFLKYSPLLNTEVLDILKPYEGIMKNRTPKYKEVSKEENERLIEGFLSSRKKELEDKEQEDLASMCKSVKKGILARIRDVWKKFIQKIRNKNNKEK